MAESRNPLVPGIVHSLYHIILLSVPTQQYYEIYIYNICICYYILCCDCCIAGTQQTIQPWCSICSFMARLYLVRQYVRCALLNPAYLYGIWRHTSPYEHQATHICHHPRHHHIYTPGGTKQRTGHHMRSCWGQLLLLLLLLYHCYYRYEDYRTRRLTCELKAIHNIYIWIRLTGRTGCWRTTNCHVTADFPFSTAAVVPGRQTIL